MGIATSPVGRGSVYDKYFRPGSLIRLTVPANLRDKRQIIVNDFSVSVGESFVARSK